MARSIKLLNEYLINIPESVLEAYHEYSGLDYLNQKIDEKGKSKTMFIPSELPTPPQPIVEELHDPNQIELPI
jgi:hypothetical protein